MPSAVLFSTDAEFQAATRSNVVLNGGLLRFGAAGHDFSVLAGYTTRVGLFDRWDKDLFVTAVDGNTAASATIDGMTTTDHTIAGIVKITQSTTSWVGIGLRKAAAANDNGYMCFVNPAVDVLRVYKAASGVYTQLAEVAQAYAVNDVIALRLAANGSDLTAYDDTNSVNVTATDTTYSTGLAAIQFSSGGAVNAVWRSIRLLSTLLSGSASLPTSTTYVDLGAAKLMGSVSWDETLDSGDVTVDVYGSDNGTSDAAGASVTGLTDPAGSDCSAAGSHRYWRVVVNFTRTLTTQEPTVSRIALNQTVAVGGGTARSAFAGAGMRVS